MRRFGLVLMVGLVLTVAACRNGSLAFGQTPIRVTFNQSLGCATFPYGCLGRLSVLAPGTAFNDAWRPPSSDPTWAGQASGGFGDVQTAATSPSGRHLLVFSVLGTSDVPTYGPDGALQTELIGRCSVEADIPAQSEPVEVVVDFSGDGSALCTIAVAGLPSTAPSDTRTP
jgi:hypothetical protein